MKAGHSKHLTRACAIDMQWPIEHMRVCNRYLCIGHSKESTESVPNAAVTLQRLTPACARRVEHAANTLA